MRRVSLVLVGTFAVAVFSLVNAQEPTEKLPSYSVKLTLIGADKESISENPQLIKEGVSTDIPVTTTSKLENGTILSISSLSLYVPSPSIMADPKTVDKTAGSVPVGPTLTCTIRRVDETRLLLDVTLTETDCVEHEIQNGLLKTITHQQRSVQPVRRGETITLSWPAVDGIEKTRQIAITVLDSK